MKFKIQLTTQQDAVAFVKAVCTLEGEFDLSHGTYTVDAKSILGVLSLKLSEPVTLICHNYYAAIEPTLKQWIVD